MLKIILIDWRPHNRRAESLAQDIDATLYLAPNVLRKKIYGPIRYVYLAFWTIGVCLQERPDIIIVSTPPSFCPIIAYIYTRLFRCKYIVDAHHLATTGYWSKIPFGFTFNRFIMNMAAITLIHNEEIQQDIARYGINSLVLETKIPILVTDKKDDYISNFSVLVPSSFDPDEPIEEIYKVARNLPNITFYLTGDTKRLHRKFQKNIPNNVILTGYINQSDYDMLLNSVKIVLVLTGEDYPIRPRGASEAISAEKPTIATRNRATEKHLSKGVLLVRNYNAEVEQAIFSIKNNYDKYKYDIITLKKERMVQYHHEIQTLKTLMGMGLMIQL